MSMIHSSSALLGWRSALMAGTARCRTVRSMAYSTHARAITARPVHSLRPALAGGEVSVSGGIRLPRLSAAAGVEVVAGRDRTIRIRLYGHLGGRGGYATLGLPAIADPIGSAISGL